jgi:hypothetical protein
MEFKERDVLGRLRGYFANFEIDEETLVAMADYLRKHPEVENEATNTRPPFREKRRTEGIVDHINAWEKADQQHYFDYFTKKMQSDNE